MIRTYEEIRPQVKTTNETRRALTALDSRLEYLWALPWFKAKKGEYATSFASGYFAREGDPAAVSPWSNGSAHTAGDIIRNANGDIFECVVPSVGSGTTGGSEPGTWYTTLGVWTLDNSLYWEARQLNCLSVSGDAYTYFQEGVPIRITTASGTYYGIVSGQADGYIGISGAMPADEEILSVEGGISAAVHLLRFHILDSYADPAFVTQNDDLLEDVNYAPFLWIGPRAHVCRVGAWHEEGQHDATGTGAGNWESSPRVQLVQQPRGGAESDVLAQWNPSSVYGGPGAVNQYYGIQAQDAAWSYNPGCCYQNTAIDSDTLLKLILRLDDEDPAVDAGQNLIFEIALVME